MSKFHEWLAEVLKFFNETWQSLKHDP